MKEVKAAGSESLTVIYIHGIANKPAPAVLKREWDQALFGVDMGARTRMAYWADIRYPQPLSTGATERLALDVPELARPMSEAELIEESKALAPYGAEAEAFAQELAKRMLNQAKLDQAKVQDGVIRVKGVEAKILPPWIRKSATEWITKQFIQDVAAYFYNPEQREGCATGSGSS